MIAGRSGAYQPNAATLQPSLPAFAAASSAFRLASAALHAPARSPLAASLSAMSGAFSAPEATLATSTASRTPGECASLARARNSGGDEQVWVGLTDAVRSGGGA